MTEQDLMWLAGYLEGEGCFHMGGGTPCVRVAATDADVVERAAILMGRTSKLIRSGVPRRKSVFMVQVFGNAALALMRQLLPYMGSRRSLKIIEVLAASAARPGTAFGERNGRAKLTEPSIREIRQLGDAMTMLEIARKYCVDPSTISDVLRSRSWANVVGS